MYKGARWGILRSGDAMLCIYEHRELATDTSDTAHRINHFGLRITDRTVWEQTLEKEGGLVLYGFVRWPHSTAWYVHNPTGYEIEVALWDNDSIAFN